MILLSSSSLIPHPHLPFPSSFTACHFSGDLFAPTLFEWVVWEKSYHLLNAEVEGKLKIASNTFK